MNESNFQSLIIGCILIVYPLVRLPQIPESKNWHQSIGWITMQVFGNTCWNDTDGISEIHQNPSIRTCTDKMSPEPFETLAQLPQIRVEVADSYPPATPPTITARASQLIPQCTTANQTFFSCAQDTFLWLILFLNFVSCCSGSNHPVMDSILLGGKCDPYCRVRYSLGYNPASKALEHAVISYIFLYLRSTNRSRCFVMPKIQK